MKFIFPLIGFLIICLSGCDMLSTDSKNLVGNIVLSNPHNQDVNGYRMVIYHDNINSNIIEENVLEVKGNDTLLIAKCKNNNEDFLYYKIIHNKGQKPIAALVISFVEYDQIEKTINIKYNFFDKEND